MRSTFFATLVGAAVIVVVATVLWSPPSRSEGTEVDVELVLLSDVSSSMNDTERALQRQGYIKAMTAASTLEAIQDGALGRIAVTYVEFGAVNSAEIRIVARWSVISDEATAAAFAALIAEAEPFEGNSTDIGGALAFASAEIDGNEYQGLRRVIDVSGDGEHTTGTPPAPVRDEIVGRGITINGLPVGGASAVQKFEDTIVGGPGNVIVPCRDYRGFADALERKLRLEIG